MSQHLDQVECECCNPSLVRTASAMRGSYGIYTIQYSNIIVIRGFGGTVVNLIRKLFQGSGSPDLIFQNRFLVLGSRFSRT